VAYFTRGATDFERRIVMQPSHNDGYGFEGEYEGEFEDQFVGEGEFEGEFALEGEYEGEFEGELESPSYEYEGEEFLPKSLTRAATRFVKRHGNLLRSVASTVAPVVGTAVLGPAGGTLGQFAASALREEEFEGDYEDEFELEGSEGEFEGQYEGEFEFEGVEGEFEDESAMTQQQALGEMMAAIAAEAETEAEAEAMAGAAVMATLSPSDRAALRRLLPSLVRGVALLARILRRRRVTRPAVRLLPTIFRRTAQTLKKQAASGRPVTKRTAAKVMAGQTRRVLGSPKLAATALQRNVSMARAVARPRKQHYQRQRSATPVAG
jgi:hypothetical protein